MMSRRRNQMGLLVLAGVPVLLAVATKLSGGGGEHGGGADFISQVTQNGLFVPLASLTLELTLFLPMALAMVSGDAIAGEAHQGTLRYLLTVPVSRVRLLAVKYLALVFGAFVAVTVVLAAGLIAGTLLFGARPMITLSGTTIGVGAGLWRLAIAGLYVVAGLCALAAIGLFVSTLTEQPIAVTVAVMVVTSAMWIADQIPQLSFLHGWLLVDRWPAFADLIRQPPVWDSIVQGLLVDGAYAVVFLLLAWARFAGKDITS
ncbi:ABC transporter permease subunit [Calidifontibacter sp. DB0510]|uniref:ABC transporter permease subunit n=2 Tax=Metallococcus carri TaxID=1656884 RepID=A0A967B972_9MICO|nr:ABC transporter permease subunit [Metallococcus carri]NOP38051.1 ABC transporter permease subunit [Calidifontibacter sp. DB2511S]